MYFLVELSTLYTIFFHVINEWNYLNDPFGIKMLARLRLGFSYLCEHELTNGFKENLNSLCSCSIEAGTKTLFRALPL